MLKKPFKQIRSAVTTNSTLESESPAKDSPLSDYPSCTIPTVPLPKPVGDNIDAIVRLQTNSHRELPRHHRFVEAVTAFLGRPAFLYGILIVSALWILPNTLPRRFSFQRFDPPPFYWLQGAVGFSALLMTSGVLITQKRQEKLAEQRAQLTLQMNLLSEQKIAKLIALLEELRTDLPEVQNRYDSEAEMMKEAVDPDTVVNELDNRLEEELAELKRQK